LFMFTFVGASRSNLCDSTISCLNGDESISRSVELVKRRRGQSVVSHALAQRSVGRHRTMTISAAGGLDAHIALLLTALAGQVHENHR